MTLAAVPALVARTRAVILPRTGWGRVTAMTLSSDHGSTLTPRDPSLVNRRACVGRHGTMPGGGHVKY